MLNTPSEDVLLLICFSCHSAIPEDEKEEIRKRLICRFNEPVPQVSFICFEKKTTKKLQSTATVKDLNVTVSNPPFC